jgi:hypothetical protein
MIVFLSTEVPPAVGVQGRDKVPEAPRHTAVLLSKRSPRETPLARYGRIPANRSRPDSSSARYRADAGRERRVILPATTICLWRALNIHTQNSLLVFTRILGLPPLRAGHRDSFLSASRARHSGMCKKPAHGATELVFQSGIRPFLHRSGNWKAVKMACRTMLFRVHLDSNLKIAAEVHLGLFQFLHREGGIEAAQGPTPELQVIRVFHQFHFGGEEAQIQGCRPCQRRQLHPPL